MCVNVMNYVSQCWTNSWTMVLRKNKVIVIRCIMSKSHTCVFAETSTFSWSRWMDLRYVSDLQMTAQLLLFACNVLLECLLNRNKRIEASHVQVLPKWSCITVFHWCHSKRTDPPLSQQGQTDPVSLPRRKVGISPFAAVCSCYMLSPRCQIGT